MLEKRPSIKRAISAASKYAPEGVLFAGLGVMGKGIIDYTQNPNFHFVSASPNLNSLATPTPLADVEFFAGTLLMNVAVSMRARKLHREDPFLPRAIGYAGAALIALSSVALHGSEPALAEGLAKVGPIFLMGSAVYRTIDSEQKYADRR